jgi:hypothetical protein
LKAASYPLNRHDCNLYVASSVATPFLNNAAFLTATLSKKLTLTENDRKITVKRLIISKNKVT